MSGHVLKRIAGCTALAGAFVFLGWRYGAYVETVADPGVNRLVPHPPGQIVEIIPPTDIPPRALPYRAESGDVPGWRVWAVGDATAAVPWRNTGSPLWRQPLGGAGNSSPIVVGEQIFFTIADGGPTLWLVCFNLKNGFGVWRQPVSREPFPARHEKTSDAASTPCSDGAKVFVSHASADTVHLSAFGLDGERHWTTPLGPFNARWGFSSSPAWHGGVVVSGADNPADGFLAAVDAGVGRIVWRRRRPRSGDESYSSPVIVAAGVGISTEPQVVMAGLGRLESVSLADGRGVWGLGGISHTSGATPVVAGDICVATSGFPTRTMVAVRIPPGGGTPVRLWKEDRDSEIPYVPSPLVHDGRLYVLHDDGVAHCRDLATGRVAWKRRVGGTFSASPVLVNGELLCVDESGRCTLLALDDGKLQHEFTLQGGCFATPAVVRGRLIIRSTDELVAFDVAAR